MTERAPRNTAQQDLIPEDIGRISPKKGDNSYRAAANKKNARGGDNTAPEGRSSIFSGLSFFSRKKNKERDTRSYLAAADKN